MWRNATAIVPAHRYYTHRPTQQPVISAVDFYPVHFPAGLPWYLVPLPLDGSTTVAQLPYFVPSHTIVLSHIMKSMGEKWGSEVPALFFL